MEHSILLKVLSYSTITHFVFLFAVVLPVLLVGCIRNRYEKRNCFDRTNENKTIDQELEDAINAVID